MPRDRHDVLMVTRRFTQGLAEGRNIPIEVAVLDDGTGPDRFHQLFLDEHLTAVLDQQKKNLERLGGQWNLFGATQQKTPAGIDAKRTELVKAPGPAVVGFFRNFSELLHRHLPGRPGT